MPYKLRHYGVYFALVFGLVPYGAVHDLTKLFVGLVISVLSVFAIWIDIRKDAVRKLARDCWIAMAILVFWALLQSVSYQGNPLAHVFWQTAGALENYTSGAISVEPGLTLFALFSLIPPFLLFIAILHTFQGDEEIWLLIRFLGILAFLFILYGLLQASLFPNYTLLRDWGHNYHAFTGTLIYRNASATVLALSSLVFLALLIQRARGISLFSFPIALVLPHAMPTKRRASLAFWSLGLFLSLIALFLTHSRGALGATILAWAILSPPLLSLGIARSMGGERQFGGSRYNLIRRIAFVVLVVAIAIGFLNIFAEETLFRFAELKGENRRFCNYPSIWRAFLDNWQMGTGFGTFEVVFPIYRDPVCGVDGIWLQAHNSWLEALMGFGVMFVPVLLFCLFRLAGCFWTGVRTRRSQRFIAYIGFGALALVGLHGSVDFSLQIPGVALYLSAFLASVCALSLGRSSRSR